MYTKLNVEYQPSFFMDTNNSKLRSYDDDDDDISYDETELAEVKNKKISINGQKMGLSFPKIEKHYEAFGKTNYDNNNNANLNNKTLNKLNNVKLHHKNLACIDIKSSSDSFNNNNNTSKSFQLLEKDSNKFNNNKGSVRSNLKLESIKMQIYQNGCSNCSSHSADDDKGCNCGSKQKRSVLLNNNIKIKPLYLKKQVSKPKLASFRDTFISESSFSTSKLKIKQINLNSKKEKSSSLSLAENVTKNHLEPLSINSNQNSSRDINDTGDNNISSSLNDLNNSNTTASQVFQVLKTMKQIPDVSKAIFKPKTPLHFSPDKRIHDVKTPIGPRNGRWSPIKLRNIKTPRLYDRFNLDNSKTELDNLFNKLDHDKDGHLNYDVVKKYYCDDMKNAPKSFFHQIYEILSETTFFGLKEFKSFVALVQEFKKTDEEPKNFYWDYFKSIDFNDFRKDIKEFIKLVDALDFSNDLKVEDVLKAKLRDIDVEKLSASSNKVADMNNLNKQLKIEINGENMQTKLINYILMIPLYLHVESMYKNKSLYQRHQVSIINMKDATNFHNFNKRNQ